MKLFTGLKKIREFERQQLPFLKSVLDFDIVIEIGYAEEQGQPLTLKQLFLLNMSSRTTVRRKLAMLIEQEIVVRRKHANDHRSSLLLISPLHCQTAKQVWRDTYSHFGIAFPIGCRQSVHRDAEAIPQSEYVHSKHTLWVQSWLPYTIAPLWGSQSSDLSSVERA